SRERRLAEQRRHRYPLNVRIVGNGVENGRDQLLEYAPQAARSGLVLEGQLGDLLEDLRIDGELDAFVLEDFPELAVDRVFRLDHDPHQHFAGEILKPGDDGQAAGELGYQAVREQIGRLHARVQAIQQFLIVG